MNIGKAILEEGTYLSLLTLARERSASTRDLR